MRRWLGFVIAVAACSFCLAACTSRDGSGGDGGQDGDGSQQSGSDDGVSSTGEDASGADTGESGSGDDDDNSGGVSTSPLLRYVGIDFGEEFEVERIEADRKVQEEIAVCMRAEGFDYVPQDPSAPGFYDGGFGDRVDADGLREGTVEWTDKYGFGFSTLAFSQVQVGPDLVGYDDEHRATDLSPNAEFVANLSPEERDAYRAALSGTEEDYENADPADLLNGLGCSGAAVEKYGLNFNERQFGLWEEFGDELSELADLAATHPTVVTAEREVSGCVVEQGFEMIDAQTAGASIKVSLQPVYDAANSLVRTEEELAAGVPATEFPGDVKALLAEIQRNEIDHAMAIFECGGGATGSYNDAFTGVRDQMQENFIEENRDRLDAFILSQS